MNRRQLAQALAHCRVTPGRRLDLAQHPTDWLPFIDKDEKAAAEMKDRAAELLDESRQRLAEAQELLYANDRFSLLVILQGLDAAGKDGIVKHVMSGVNPAGCQVTSFKQPSAEELDHDFLWRYHCRLPPRGTIGLFNRSYYEEVLVVRVHPEILANEKLPPRAVGPRIWKERFESIRSFETHLTRNGTIIRKFFLNVSQQEQHKRLLERLDEPHKFWKFNPADVEERRYWDDYMHCFTEALSATSTRQAPWYVIPADRKWLAHSLVAYVLAETIASLKLAFPKPTAAEREAMEKAKKILRKE